MAALGAEYNLGARAGQIRDDLLALAGNITPADMLRIQLDDRAVFLDRWRTLLLALLDADSVRGSAAARRVPRARRALERAGERRLRSATVWCAPTTNARSEAVWGMLLGALRIPAGR